MALPNLRRLVTNIASLGVVRGLEYLVPLVTMPYIVNTIGLAGYGEVGFANSFANYFGAIAQYGFHVTAVRNLAQAGQNSKLISQLFSETVVARTYLSVLTIGLFVGLVLFIPAFADNAALFLSALASVLAVSAYPLWFFRGVEALRTSAILTGIGRLGYMVAVFLLVKEPGDAHWVPLSNAIALSIITIIAYAYIMGRYRLKVAVPPIRRVIAVYADGFNVFIANIAPNLYNNSAVFLLGLFAGPIATGIYTAAFRVAGLFTAAVQILSNAMFPYVVRVSSSEALFRKVLLTVGLLSAGIMYGLGRPFATLFFQEQAALVVPAIRWLSISVLAFAGVQAYSHLTLLVRKFDRHYRIISMTFSVLSFVFGLIAIPFWGVAGAIAMYTGGLFSIGTASLIVARRHKLL